MRRSYLVFKEMTSARGSVRSSLEGGTSFSFYILENCITTLRWPFFFVQVLPPLPRPLPAVDRRNARPVRGRQHHDQDAGVVIFVSLFFLKVALLFAGDQRHAQPLPRLPDQDSSQDRRRSHPTPPGELFRLADLNILLYTLTFSSTLILNISLSRVKTAGRYRW